MYQYFDTFDRFKLSVTISDRLRSNLESERGMGCSEKKKKKKVEVECPLRGLHFGTRTFTTKTDPYIL